MELYNYKTDIDEKIVYKEGKKYLRKTTRKIKKTFFDGCYIGAVLNKKIADHIYLIPNNLNDTIVQRRLNNYINVSGEEIILENLEFSKKYKVYSKDQIQARYILTLSLMERINKIDKIYDGKKYIVFKEGRRFVICIEGLSVGKILNNSLPLVRNNEKEHRVLMNIFTDLSKLFSIYDILDLGNDVYTKYN